MDRRDFTNNPMLQPTDDRLRATTVGQQQRGHGENKETVHNVISLVKVNTCKKEEKTCLWHQMRKEHECILNEGDLLKKTNMRLRLR